MKKILLILFIIILLGNIGLLFYKTKNECLSAGHLMFPRQWGETIQEWELRIDRNLEANPELLIYAYPSHCLHDFTQNKYLGLLNLAILFGWISMVIKEGKNKKK